MYMFLLGIFIITSYICNYFWGVSFHAVVSSFLWQDNSEKIIDIDTDLIHNLHINICSLEQQ